MHKGGCSMSEERAQVLEMLVTGKVTVEQANQLLKALGEEPLSQFEKPSNQRQSEGQQEPVYETWEHRDTQKAPHFTFDEIMELSEHGVEPDYLKALRDGGLIDLTVDQIIELSEHGVEAAYLMKLGDAEMANLSVDQIIELSEHG